MAESTDTIYPPSEGEFGASELGTKRYWDDVYQRENKNFDDNGDIGEIWFGEESVNKMCKWINDHVHSKDSMILDIGCGNGHLLLELASLSFINLTGIDYSASAIQLAHNIAVAKKSSHISYEVVDFLYDSDWLKGRRFDVILDKGTYDAICLSPEQEEGRKAGRRGPADIYLTRVKEMLNSSESRLLITSCNWTKEELIRKFDNDFLYVSHIKYPIFTFGGVSGSRICTVAFKPK